MIKQWRFFYDYPVCLATLTILFVCSIPTICSGQSAESDGYVATADSTLHSYPSLNLTVGFLVGEPGLTLSASYTAQKTKSVGFGVGLDYARYSNFLPHSIVAPFATYRMMGDYKKVQVYSMARLGYGIPVSSWDNGSLSAQGGIFSGLKFGVVFGQQNPYLDLSLGFRIQKATFQYESFGSMIFDDILFKRFELNLGVKI